MQIPTEVSQMQLLETSPAYFIKTIFGYRIDAPHYNILEHYEQSQETLDLAPRGCGKTRIGNIGYCSWQAANNPNIRILIVSDTDTHAVRFLGTIKAVLESHPLIKQYYGDLKGESKWTDHEITLKTRTDKTLTEATISAMGAYSGAVTGGHFDIIIADDLANYDNSRTEAQRERMKEWFKISLMPTLIPGGELHCLATKYHYYDLWNMVEKELGFDTQIQKAIKDDGMSIWEYHLPLHDEIKQGVKIKGLETIKNELGSIIFSLQYQNNADLLQEGNIFQYDWFRFYSNLYNEDGALYIEIEA